MPNALPKRCMALFLGHAEFIKGCLERWKGDLLLIISKLCQRGCLEETVKERGGWVYFVRTVKWGNIYPILGARQAQSLESNHGMTQGLIHCP